MIPNRTASDAYQEQNRRTKQRGVRAWRSETPAEAAFRQDRLCPEQASMNITFRP